MPTYSDDGQWWWDGNRWQPVAPQPPQAQYPPPQGQYGVPQYAAPPPARRRGVVWLLVGAAVLAVGIPAGVFFWPKGGSATASGSSASGGGQNNPAAGKGEIGAGETGTGKTIEPGQAVTAQALKDVDARAFYESVLKRQMTRPIGLIRSVYFQDEAEFNDRTRTPRVNEDAIDHRTNRFIHNFTQRSGSSSHTTRCIAGKEYWWSTVYQRYQLNPYSKTSVICGKKPYDAGDGVVSTGLTAAQADTVIQKLREEEGFINASQPTLITAGGKTYVRQVVHMPPIKQSDGEYYGVAIPMWAFRAAGLDPVTWPWSGGMHNQTGVHAVYYYDPYTLLPVAQVQTYLDNLDKDGKPSVKQPGVGLYRYWFPATLPTQRLPRTEAPITITLPEGWKVVR